MTMFDDDDLVTPKNKMCSYVAIRDGPAGRRRVGPRALFR